MAEWPSNQESNRIVISTISSEALGAEIGCFNVAPTSAQCAAVNTALFVPFVVHRSFVAVKMAVANGAAVAGNIDLGIYDDQQNRIVSVGSTAQAGVSAVQSVDITDTTLLPGVYFMALNSDNATGQFYRWATGSPGNIGAFGVYSQAVGALTLPDPAVFAKPTTQSIPHLMVTGRTVV